MHQAISAIEHLNGQSVFQISQGIIIQIFEKITDMEDLLKLGLLQTMYDGLGYISQGRWVFACQLVEGRF